MKHPEKTLAITIKNLSNQFHRYMMATKANIEQKIDDAKDVTELQGRIVSYLYSALENDDGEGVYQKDIEKYFNIRRSTATIIMKRMVKNGLITRKVSAADARMKAISLTQRARKMYPIAHEEVVRAEAQAIKGLTKEELEVFLRVAEKISANISCE